jgi:hypothetical protein
MICKAKSKKEEDQQAGTVVRLFHFLVVCLFPGLIEINADQMLLQMKKNFINNFLLPSWIDYLNSILKKLFGPFVFPRSAKILAIEVGCNFNSAVYPVPTRPAIQTL